MSEALPGGAIPAGDDRPDALSLAAIAAGGDAPALITADGALSFADLAARAAEVSIAPAADRAAPLVASPDQRSVIALVAHVARGRAIALLHPRVAEDERARQAAAAAAHPVPAGTLAVVFTSGSTGQPRGVVLSRASALAAVEASAAHLGWRDDNRWLLALPLAHVGGLAVLLRCLAAHRAVVIAAEPGADAIARAIARGRATLASLVPTQLDALLEAGWQPPPHLRAILLGGAAASPVLLDRAAARGVPFLTTYGMTETWGQVATQPVDTAGTRAAPAPLPGVTLEAGTAEHPALIRVRTPTRATGTLGDPELGRPETQPWRTTSDLGWLDARGHLHVTGRADDVVITGGENVHPLEVEAHVASAPGVAAACAFGIPDERWGQVLAVAIVAGPGFDRDALVAHAARLGPHHRPRRLAILASLPLGATGKVDRRAVAAAATPLLAPIVYPQA